MYFNDQNTQFPLLQTELRKLYVMKTLVHDTHTTNTHTHYAPNIRCLGVSRIS